MILNCKKLRKLNLTGIKMLKDEIFVDILQHNEDLKLKGEQPLQLFIEEINLKM